MLVKGIVPQSQVIACEKALISHLRDKGRCNKHKFKSYVCVFFDKDVLQRVGAWRTMNKRKTSAQSYQKNSAIKFVDGEILDEKELSVFFERGATHIAERMMTKRNVFKKTSDGFYELQHADKPEGTKTCSKCKKELPTNDFSWSSKAKKTLNSACSKCRSSYDRRTRKQKGLC